MQAEGLCSRGSGRGAPASRPEALVGGALGGRLRAATQGLRPKRVPSRVERAGHGGARSFGCVVGRRNPAWRAAMGVLVAGALPRRITLRLHWHRRRLAQLAHHELLLDEADLSLQLLSSLR